MRRTLGTVFCAVLLSACANGSAQDLGASLIGGDAAPAVAAGPQLPSRPGRVFTAADPARIMVIGDSLSQGFADALKARAAERGIAAVVTNRGRVSTGLSRSDFYDWPAAFAELAPAEKPDIVVAHFGANDMQGVVRPENKAGYGSEGWDAAYRAEVDRILATAAENKIVLMWLGPAPDGNTNLGKHMTMIAPLFAEEAKAHNAIFLPLADFTSGPAGEYVTSVPIGGKDVTIRTGDGSHFNGTGYRLVADRILDDLLRRFPDLEPGPDLLAALQ